MRTLTKKAIAEFVGTFVLVFIACGTAGITRGSVVPTSLAFGLTIVAMAYSVGRISGCHINPAVSLGCLLTKRMTAKEFGIYVISQILGGLMGSMLVFGIMKMANIQFIGDACNYAIQFDAQGLTVGGVVGALMVEIVLTCVFVYTILNVTDSKANSSRIAGVVIGLTLTLVHILGINFTGTSVNPARSIATALSALIYNGTTDAIAQVWIFIVAPLIGAVVASILYIVLHTNEEE